MTRSHHIAMILRRLYALADAPTLLPSEQTTVRLAIAEIERLHPARVTRHDLDTAPCEVEPRDCKWYAP